MKNLALNLETLGNIRRNLCNSATELDTTIDNQQLDDNAPDTLDPVCVIMSSIPGEVRGEGDDRPSNKKYWGESIFSSLQNFSPTLLA